MKNNKPSATALFVANGMYFNIQQENLREEISPESKQYFTRLIEHIYEVNSVGSKKILLLRTAFKQRFSVKGFYLHFLVRKKCIEDHLLNALREGYEQVIILGAGYDTLSSRLAPNFPEINFIEIDHPATSEQKIALFRELKWGSHNLRYISLDLKNIEELFSSSQLDKQLKTVFICEGVLMYLTEKDVENILNSIKRHFSSSKFIFTFMNESSPGNYMFKVQSVFLKLYLKMMSEPFTWGIKATDLKKYLSDKGWVLIDIYDHDKLRKNYLSEENRSLHIAIGEQVAICENKIN